MTTDLNQLLRSLPQVDQLLQSEALAGMRERFPRVSVLRAVRQTLDDVRAALREGREMTSTVPEGLAPLVLAALEGSCGRGLRRVVNATGIVAHTGLGRSVLPEDAVQAIAEEARGYCLLQIDRESTGRTKRDQFCVELLKEISGAEAGTVVNNNCAATMLMLNSLADQKEVIISRGQLVEIGGAFRIPDVLRRSGATLVEVGCTNKTHLRDYEEAITERTGLIMRVHTSNYKMVGFVKEVPIEELAELGQQRGIPVVDDLGAGAFLDLRPMGFPEEPLVQTSVRAGADIISMSADKLIGGPQGGIILGKEEYIDRIRKNPLARMVRVGKLTLIALEATLKYFLDRERTFKSHPTTRMLTMELAELERRARAIAQGIGEILGATIEVREDTSEVGSGSYPAHQIPTFVVAIQHRSLGAAEISRRLRTRPYGVFGRISRDQVLLDPRTIQEDEFEVTSQAVREVLGTSAP